jgi:hypothetical protein
VGVWGLLILPDMDIIKLQNTNQFFLSLLGGGQGCMLNVLYLKHILWEAIGKTPSCRTVRKNLVLAVTGCGVDKVMNCGEFPGEANVATFSCCNSLHIGLQESRLFI